MSNEIDNIVDARIIDKMMPVAELMNDVQRRLIAVETGESKASAPSPEQMELIKAIQAEIEAIKAAQTTNVKFEYTTPKGAKGTKENCHPDVPVLYASLVCQKLHDRNIYLWGEAGSGKTHAAKEIAEMLKLPMYISGTAMTKYDHLGFKLPTGDLVLTSFVDAWRNGGVCILDDNDRSEAKAMAALNAATANGDADLSHLGLGRVERHKDCYLIVTGNTPMLGGDSKFAAAGKQDAAFRDRFIFFEMKLDEAFELKITPYTDWTKRVQRIRKAVRQIGGNVEQTVLATMRASFQGAGLLATKLISQEMCEEMTIFKGTGEDIKSLVYAECGKPSTAKSGKLLNFE